MTAKDSEIAVFRACASAILSLDLDADAASAAASSFRQGQLGPRLAMLLDGLAASEQPIVDEPLEVREPPSPKPEAHTTKGERVAAPPRSKPTRDVSPVAIFDDVKRKKISKSRLFSLLSQINPEVFTTFSEDISMREAISEFATLSTPEDWELVVDVIKGATGADPYLAQITGGR